MCVCVQYAHTNPGTSQCVANKILIGKGEENKNLD